MSDETPAPPPLILNDADEIEALKRIRRKMLAHWESLLDNKEITATDMATLTRLANQNGWVLDATRLPERLKDKLTATFDPTVPDEDDKIIPIRAQGGKK